MQTIAESRPGCSNALQQETPMQEGDHPRPDLGRRELARLRDRTDEIELIISGLTTFALFTLPSFLFEQFANYYTHLSLAMLIGGTVGTTVITGLCYGLASCFLVHLLTRAYWVGLIGLRTTFPEGINWERTPGLGPLTRERYRQRIPNLDQAIAASDRVASSLFAVISLIALAVLWLGLLMLITVIVGGVVGAQFGIPTWAITVAFVSLTGLVAGVPALLWLLDAQIGRRRPRLAARPVFRRLVGALGTLNGFILPQRLILPVQLTLQSNTRPLVFLLSLALGVFLIVAIGQIRYAGWTHFSLSGEFRFLSDEALSGGRRSGHYQDMRSPLDRLRPWPMIPSYRQQGGFVEWFIPYQPLRDNPMLELLCAEATAKADGACLKQLWAAELNGEPVALDTFMPTERADLRMLGLTGLVLLAGIAPGLQQLSIVWNPLGDTGTTRIDDRYAAPKMEFPIPFLFMPNFEGGLDAETGRTPAALTP